jgi:two-component system nitrogen regulation response regulator NtrX
VDDEEDIRQLASDILEDEGYVPRTASNSTEVFTIVGERPPAAVILDIWLQGSELDGLGILEVLKAKYPALPVIIISGHGNIETAVHSIRLGAYDYLEKPFKEDKLLLVLKRAIENARLKRENDELKRDKFETSGLIGRSAAVTQLKAAIERVGPTESRVMITGASGVGKEVVARQIHLHSKRKQHPLVVLNAASVASHEMEIELFGTESPLGLADKPRKVGLLEYAHGGTLYIDEVVDMPPPVQARLLRLLQEQSYIRVGGQRKISIDVRVMASTSRDVEQAIAARKFREDLYYRLNVVPLRVPSLCERREDIPALVEYFVRFLTRVTGLPERVFGEDVVATMQAYDWPGNVSQLRNVIEWLLIMAPGEKDQPIKASMLPPEITSIAPSSVRSGINADIMSMPLREARELFEKQYLMAQINRFGGNISKTSTFIGMERSALHRKLKMLQVNTSEALVEA